MVLVYSHSIYLGNCDSWYRIAYRIPSGWGPSSSLSYLYRVVFGYCHCHWHFRLSKRVVHHRSGGGGEGSYGYYSYYLRS